MSQHEPKCPQDMDWRTQIEKRMSDYEAAMVGDFKNPQGMMQNMLRVMNTLYHESEGVIAKQANYEKRLAKYDRMLYIGFGIVIAVQAMPTVVGWLQALVKVKP